VDWLAASEMRGYAVLVLGETGALVIEVKARRIHPSSESREQSGAVHNAYGNAIVRRIFGNRGGQNRAAPVPNLAADGAPAGGANRGAQLQLIEGMKSVRP
jgi:hypothetical protein